MNILRKLLFLFLFGMIVPVAAMARTNDPSITLDAISKEMVIDQRFEEANKISLPDNPTKIVIESKGSEILTQQQIIESMLPEELKGQKIDLDFDEVKLSDIFMTVGKAGKINVMLDPVIKNNQLDLHLKQVTIPEAFNLIANAYNLGYKRVENSLFVTVKDKLKEQNTVSKVVKIQNMRAEEAKTLIGNLVEVVNVSDEINSLVMVGDPTSIVNAERLIKEVDVPQPQVLLEASIIEVNKDALKDLGVDWSDSISISYQESDRPSEFSTTESAISKLYNVAQFQRFPIQFTTVIKMLENQNKAKVLSNPRVTTLNNKQAEIFVGDRLPYTVTTVSGGVATTDVRFEEPGIRLKITPSIIQDDFVVIKVEPEVSYIYSFRGANDQFPWVKKRQATANVRVQNRQPFVLGGLLNQEDKKNLYKVPVIGNIPLLGNLFSYEKHTALDTELIITITPTIVHGNTK